MEALKKRLHMGRLKAATQVRRCLFADLPVGTTPEDVMVPDYWAHHTSGMQAMDLLEVMTEDGAWEGLFRVMFVSKVEARLAKIYVVKHDKFTVEDAQSVSHEVVWRGPVAKFGVVRKDTKEVVKDRFGTKEEAIKFLGDHLKQVG